MKKLLHIGIRVLAMHPTLGPGPYLTMCKLYFRNDKNAPIAKPPEKANCPDCLKEYERAVAEAKRKVEQFQKVIERAA